jgi:hypothetical protein
MKFTLFSAASLALLACARTNTEHAERLPPHSHSDLEYVECVIGRLMAPDGERRRLLTYDPDWKLDVQKMEIEWEKLRRAGVVRIVYFFDQDPSTYQWRVADRRLTHVGHGIIRSDFLACATQNPDGAEVRIGRWIFQVSKERRSVEFSGFVVSG